MAYDNLPPDDEKSPEDFPGGMLLRNRMTEAEYDRERHRLRDLYGDSSVEAAAKRDQAMAKLFLHSNWTQEEIAAKEGKSRPWVVCRVRFARFLDFVTTVTNSEKLPKNLTEGRFREFWSQTNREDGNDLDRFQAVYDLITERSTVMQPRRPKIGDEIVKEFGDGKWHSPSVIAERLDVPVDHVESTLTTMRALRGTYNAKCERKQVGRGHHYRIFKRDHQVSSAELTEKLAPIVEGLMLEGKKNAATIAPRQVIILAHQLQKLLKEWSE